ncbi:MAG TPA: hypothetical protein VK971_01785 [Thiohalobacter sp.]|nr:hypothetical protein [Thiohalobacter sp.]
MSETATTATHRVTARSARFSAAVFNYGNIISLLAPFPLMIFWLGASMFVYAMNRHHPNEKVGHYTQQAAYRLYGVTGFFVAVAMFLPVNLNYYLIAWAIGATILLPLTLRDLIRIRRESWEDMEILAEPQE